MPTGAAPPVGRDRVLAGAVYLSIALYCLYPAWVSPTHGVVGDWTHPDALGNHWLYRWIPEMLSRGGSILHNDRYYWPVGDAPFLAGNGSDAVPFTALGSWVDWPFSVTVWCLLTVVLNGFGGLVLAEAAGVAGGGALVTGAFVAFSPYVARELSAGRFAQAGLWTSAFFLAAWLRLLREPGWRRAAWAGLWFSLAAFQYWYYGLWMALAGVCFWLGRPRVGPVLRFLPFALAGTVPPLALFLANWGAIPGVEEVAFPHPLSIDYALSATFPVWSGTGSLASLALPLGLSALAWAGLRGADAPLRRGVLVAAALFYALCLGPELLTPAGESTGVPGPYQLVYRWSPVLQRFWWPYRHLAPLTLVLLPLVARGAQRLLAWLDVAYAPLVLVALIPIESYGRGAVVEVSSSWFTPPASYRALAELPAGNVLELPLFEKIARNESSLSYQWVHGHTLLAGHAMWVDRVRPQAWDAWVAQQPLLAALRSFEAGKLTGAWALDGAPWADGAVAYVTLNREYFPGELAPLREAHAAFLTAWYGPAVIKGGGVAVWDVRGPPAETTYVWPSWSPPAGYVSSSGLASLPESVRAAGWRNWPRTVPPAEPEVRSASKEREARTARLPPMLRRKLAREAAERDTGTAR